MVTRKKLQNEIYKTISYLTSHKYYDDNWNGAMEVFKAIRHTIEINGGDYELVVSVENGGYHVSSDGQSAWKGYNLQILDKETEKVKLAGYLNCHAAGSVECPFDGYDMSLVVSLI